eukprot:370190-Hanusia_phi.AAC.1
MAVRDGWTEEAAARFMAIRSSTRRPASCSFVQILSSTSGPCGPSSSQRLLASGRRILSRSMRAAPAMVVILSAGFLWRLLHATPSEQGTD